MQRGYVKRYKSVKTGAREVAQLVIGVVRMSIVAGSILVGASFLPKMPERISEFRPLCPRKLPPHCPGPLFPPQSKTVEGTCSVGYRLRDHLTWARSLPDRSEDCADGWVRTNLADLLLSKDKRVLHLECDLLLRGCFEFPCTTLSPRLPTIKTFPLHPSQLHSFNSHRPKAIAR